MDDAPALTRINSARFRTEVPILIIWGSMFQGRRDCPASRLGEFDSLLLHQFYQFKKAIGAQPKLLKIEQFVSLGVMVAQPHHEVTFGSSPTSSWPR